MNKSLSFTGGPRASLRPFFIVILGLISIVTSAFGQVETLEALWEEEASLPGYARTALERTLPGTGTANALEVTFNVEVGDEYTFHAQTFSGQTPVVRVLSPTRSVLVTDTGSGRKWVRIQNWETSTPGTYTAQLYFNDTAADLRVFLSRTRGGQLESENNDSVGSATFLEFTGTGGSGSHRIAGLLDAYDLGDIFDLGYLGAAANLQITIGTPSGSNLDPSDVRLSLWREGEGSPIVTSQSGGLNHIVAVAGVHYIQVDLTGPEDYLSLDGSSSIALGNPVELQQTGDQTIEFWARADAMNTRRNPWAKAYGGEGTLTMETNGDLNYFYGTAGANTQPYQGFNSGYLVPQSLWTHYALVRDLSASQPKLRWYINGELHSEADASYPAAAASTLNAFIGQGYVSNFVGGMSQVRVWDRALTGTEVKDGLSVSTADLADTTGLVAGWDFASSVDSILDDLSANEVDGTFSGSPLLVNEPQPTPYTAALRAYNADYLLTVVLTDDANLQVVDNSLPETGIPTQSLISSFTVELTNVLDPSSAEDPTNYVLTWSGEDGVLGTADDTLLSLNPALVDRRTVRLSVLEAPLLPGDYNFTVTTGLIDRLGNALSANESRTFTVESLGTFVSEIYPNNDFGTASPVQPLENEFSGTFFYESAVATGDRPWDVKLVDLDGDTDLDAVAVAENGGLYVYEAAGDGTFAAGIQLATGSYNRGLLVEDLFGNGRPDIVVSARNSHRVVVFENTDSVDFSTRIQELGSFATTTYPQQLDTGDFNEDGNTDIIVAHEFDPLTSLLLSDGAGSFTVSTVDTPATGTNGAVGVQVADFNGDNHDDFVLAHHRSRNLQIYHGDGTGAFISQGTLAGSTSNRDFGYLAVNDINEDGALDIVASYNYNDRYDIFGGDGSGGFDAVRSYALGGFYFQHDVTIVEQGLEPDFILLGGSSGLHVIRSLPNPDGFSLQLRRYSNTGNSHGSDLGDINGDGFLDLATAHYDGDNILLLFGQPTAPVIQDPTVGGNFEYAHIRGLLQQDQVDYYQFSVDEAKRLNLAIQTINPGTYWSRMRVRIYDASFNQLTNFVGGVDGAEADIRINLDQAGTYYFSVEEVDDYYGEYRVRLSTFDFSYGWESENNDSTSQADGTGFVATTPGVLSEQQELLWAYHPSNENAAGDFFRLPNLGPGTTIDVDVETPASSPLNVDINIWDGSGNVILDGAVGLASQNLTLTAPVSSPYFVQIDSEGGTRGLLSEYLLSVTLSDTTPPVITGTTLPAEPTSGLPNIFSISFDEDMLASTLNDPANYEMRGSGEDGIFDTADDILWPVGIWTNYSEGLLHTLYVPEGPLSPGEYRFTAFTGIQDRFGNSLVSNYTHNFTITGVATFVLETESNDSSEAADFLGTTEPGFGGSFDFNPSISLPTSNQPWRLTSGDFNGDGHEDVATVTNGQTLQVFLSDGAGGFESPGTFSIGGNSGDVISGDVNGDTLPDLVVSHPGGRTIIILHNTDDESLGAESLFTVASTINTNRSPRQLALAEVNGDNAPDILAADYDGGVILLLSDGLGGFTQSQIDGSRAFGIVAGEFTGDSLTDIVYSSHTGRSVHILENDGAGSFTEYQVVPGSTTNRNAYYMASADFNQDGYEDIVMAYDFNDRFDLFEGRAGGGLNDAIDRSSGGFINQFTVRAGDFNNDGWPDVSLSQSNGFRLYLNNQSSTQPLGASLYYNTGATYDTTFGEFTGDGLVDILTLDYNSDRVRVYPGQTPITLPSDPGPINLTMGTGRGYLSDSQDQDYYRFYAETGNRIQVLTQSMTTEYWTRFRFILYDPAGNQLLNFVTGVAGAEAQSQTTANLSGQYTALIQRVDEYYGEYRFRVSVVGESLQIESENNNQTSQADGVTFADQGSAKVGQYFGALPPIDTSGDFYSLGNLGTGTQITLDIRLADAGTMVPVLQIYDPSSAPVSTSTAGDPQLQYTIPEGSAGNYYARVYADGSTGDFFSQYALTFTLEDATPPVITADTLPEEGSTITSIFDRFTLSFSEDMTAATVNDPANYELVSSGENGIFGDADDVAYTVALLSSYGSGLSASYWIPDGPPQPGTYRLTVSTGLQDLATNPLDQPFVREWTAEPVPDVLFESRSNDSFDTADPLSSQPTAFWDGSFGISGDIINTQDTPWYMQEGDFTGDGIPDVAVIYWVPDRLRVYPGTPEGGLGTPTEWTIYDNSYHMVVGDWNKDGRDDIAVTHDSTNRISVFLSVDDPAIFSVSEITLDHANGRQAAVGDFNNDTHPDIVVAHHGPEAASLLLGDGIGNFASSSFSLSATAQGVAVADFNDDGLDDLAFASYAPREISRWQNLGSSNFEKVQVFDGFDRNPYFLEAGDLDGDGYPELVAAFQYRDRGLVIPGQADGLGTPIEYGFGRFTNNYIVHLDDVNLDGLPDLIWGGQAPDGLGIRYNYSTPGNLSFSGHLRFPGTGDSYNARVLDFPAADPLLVIASYNQDRLYLRSPQTEKPLQDDVSNSRIQEIEMRGNLSSPDDLDYYSFSATAGQRLMVSSRVETSNYWSRVRIRVYEGQGKEITNFITNVQGIHSHSGEVYIHHTGTYYLRVENIDQDRSPYRLRATLFDNDVRLESENNNNTSQADAIPFGHLGPDNTARIGGMIVGATGSGDYWYASNFGPGTSITVVPQAIATSPLDPRIQILDQSASVLAEAEGIEVSWTAPVDYAGPVYVRVLDDSNQRTISSSYIVDVVVGDSTPPEITSVNLPLEPSAALWQGFTLNFSEDLLFGPVRDAATYELRRAAVPGIWGAEDTLLNVVPPSYSSGLSADYGILESPLLPGTYRLVVTTDIEDKWGNPIAAPFVHEFEILGIEDYQNEVYPNDTAATATALNFIESQPGLTTAGLRGSMQSNADDDFWSFEAVAGENLVIDGSILQNSYWTRLRFILTAPDGAQYLNYMSGVQNDFQPQVINLDQTGEYIFEVTRVDFHPGEYRLWLYKSSSVADLESEGNGSIANADPVTLNTLSEDTTAGTVAGYIETNGDLDYFDLGVIEPGYSVFLSVRLPGSSSLNPVVAVYSEENVFQSEAGSGRPGDGVAEVQISESNRYFALIRPNGPTGGVQSSYVLDVQIAPTDLVSFPNLVINSIFADFPVEPRSGDSFTYSISVENAGSLDIANGGWTDRILFSTNPVVGDADDSTIATPLRTEGLVSTGVYLLSGTATIPDGFSGDLYFGVALDSTNIVNEFLFEGDNALLTEDPVSVQLRPYPDLTITGLSVTPIPDSSNWEVSWNLENTGSAPSADDTSLRLLVTRSGSVDLLTNRIIPAGTGLGVDGTRAFTETITASEGGDYRVRVIADAFNEVYEFNELGHLAAEQNTFETQFSITAFYDVLVNADPVEGGQVTGGGNFSQGTPVTVTATADTSELPYFFSRWTENGGFVSADPNYTFPVDRDRDLLAEFLLPIYPVTVAASPASGGSLSGAGNFPHGTEVSVTANPANGYIFSHWEVGGVQVSDENPYAFSLTQARTLVAVFDEANPEHVVTIATNPADVAVIPGAGTFGNGVTLDLVAPSAVVDGDTEYLFERWLLNGQLFNLNSSVSLVLTTANPANMDFIAEYTSRTLKPVVVSASANRDSPIPADLDVLFTIAFDRPMDTSVVPSGVLLSDNASSVANLPTTGTWLNSQQFRFDAVQFTTGNGGDYRLQISDATDPDARVMDPAEVFTFSADTELPAPVTVVVDDYTENSATFSWEGYAAPADLLSFRVFLEESSFTSTEGLDAAAAPPGNSRMAVVPGLSLDRTYFVTVVAVDEAGNGLREVTPLEFTTSSDVPGQVPLVVTATGPGEATLDWSDFTEEQFRGFESYAVYQSTENFTDVSGLTPLQTVPAGQQQLVIDGLDRAVPAYFAVVGINRIGQFDPAVQAEIWEDPLSGTLTTDLVLGPGVVEILQPITVDGGADFTLQPGTILRFAPSAGLTIENGRLIAQGTILEPIVLTSLEDDGQGDPPAAGDWGRLILNDPANTSVLEHFAIRFSGGLVLDSSAPQLDTVSVLNTSGTGITVQNGATLEGGPFFVFGNGLGIEVDGFSTATVNNSVIKGNATQVSVQNGSVQDFTANWWGTTNQVAIANGFTGPVNGSSALSSEPVLSAAIQPNPDSPTTGTRSINFRVGSLNAESVRLSENSNFTGVLFEDLQTDPITGGVFRFTPETLPFELSEGAGVKTVFAQFRSLTGAISDPLQFTIEYVTDGPVITAFNLSEGQLIERPINIQATATAILGMVSVELEIDGNSELLSAGGSLDDVWDVRTFDSGIRTVRLIATDTAGNIATRILNVTLAPRPPDRPTLDTPVDGTLLNTTPISAAGTAEPGIAVRLMRNATAIGTTTAGADGSFDFPVVPLVEGINRISAVAFDDLGSNVSPTAQVSLDTVAPAPLILEPPTFNPSQGLQLLWRYPEEGKRATTFRVVWNDAPFSAVAEASGQSAELEIMQYYLNNIPDGTYFIGVVGYDIAGNVSAVSNLVEYEFDASAPVFTIDYDKAIPVGPGDLLITLSTNEPLLGIPNLTIQPPQFRSPISVPLTQTSPTDFSATYIVSDLSARTGNATVRVSGRDLRGNSYSGAPQEGPALAFDVTRPQATVTVSADPPVQTTTPVSLTVNLELTKPPASGTTPELSFIPPLGDTISVPLSGTNVIWSGTLNLSAAQGDGFGTFVMNVTDSAGNTGTTIGTGSELELYTGEFPTAPGRPVGLEAETLPGGEILITWDPVDLAETYAVYREQGLADTPPTALLVDGLVGTSFTDLPPEDGIWSYVITAARRGAEGLPSGILPGNSDRTPPGVPTNVEAVLLNSGVSVSWSAPEGEVPASYKVYRNGTPIRTVQTASGIVDSPPRGLINYQVASVDPYGNEGLSTGSELELFVDAVGDLTVTLQPGDSPRLSWTNSDPNAIGYLIERDGSPANTDPVAQTFFVDPVIPESAPVVYSVRAVNDQDQRSAPRQVTVYPFDMEIGVNTAAGSEAVTPSAFFFDNYQLSLTNSSGSGSMDLNLLRAERTQSGVDPLNQDWPTNLSVGPGNTEFVDLVLPATLTRGSQQDLQIQAISGPDAAGATVIYESTVTVPSSSVPNGMVSLAVAEAPLAGGLTDFTLTIANRGYAPMEVVFSRGNGAEDGDISVSVRDSEDVEVGRKFTTGLMDGLIFRPNGDGILLIDPGETVDVPVNDVLIPESLGAEGFALFEGIADPLFNGLGSPQVQQTGPATGQVTSNLTETPYFGTSSAPQALYANDQDIILTGQALDRDTNNPVADVPLKIGISSGGFRWFEEVQTDENGAYSFTYAPPPGFSGVLNFWACHPDVFDTLEQTTVTFYRLYISPSIADIVMPLSDTLDFSLQVINPGDIPLSGFTMDSRAYTLDEDGETEIPTGEITVDFLGDPPATLGKRERRNFRFQLTTTLDTPEDPIVEFTLKTAEGAETSFRGRISLTPAIPVLSTINPQNGFVDVSVNRDDIVSREVTVKNLGLRPLEGVELVAPAGISWFQVRYKDLLPDEQGIIPMPDIPVGGERTFTVIFTPPEDAELGYVDDFLLIRGTNAESDFRLNLFAQVTSSLTGGIDFYVDNILVDPVPNASIRLRNPTLRTEVGPFLTDAAGGVLVEGLQEGEWSWQIVAPGHSTQAGTIQVIPNQNVEVRTRLSRSLVTVDFSVVPKPFTDRYEIVIEQTFETRVPFPVLVLTPPNFEFTNPEPGFETIVIVEARNEGLVSLFDGEIAGSDADYGSATPLITYVPELRAQEVIEIPMRIKFLGRSGGSGAGGSAQTAAVLDPTNYGENFGNCLSTLLIPNSLSPDVLLGLAAIMNAAAECADGVLAAVAASIAVGFDIYSAASTLANPFAVLATVIGCAIGSLFAGPGSSSSGGGGPSGGTGYGFRTECFPEYALVELVDGSEIPISEVEAGMWVRTGNSRFEKAEVSELIRLESEDLLKFELVAIGDSEDRIDFHITREHRVWTDSSGWLPAVYLKEGDLVTGRNDLLYRVVSKEEAKGEFAVFTLDLENANSLYVDGILVQDLCGPGFEEESHANLQTDETTETLN